MEPLPCGDESLEPCPVSTEPVLACERVAIRRPRVPDRPASASFEVRPGETVLLLGPSGCGKSTLALALNGLIPHLVRARVDGAVRAEGAEIGRRPLHETTAGVFLVFQDPSAQIVAETVFDEVCFALENRCLPAPGVEHRAQEALRALGLWELRDRDGRTLSGGQQQRLALACALAARPRALVLDEPTANLSPRARRELYRTLADLPGAEERAIVVIEHSVDDVLELADRVVVLDREGHTIVDADPRTAFIETEQVLRDAGVWLPFARLASARLRARGLRLDPEPLTVRELADGLARGAVAGWRLPAPALATTSRAAFSTKPVISVRGLTVDAPRTGARILEGVDIEVSPGSMFAIVGATGSGKSTLLRAIAGLVRPAAGTVHVEGRPVRVARGRAPVGLVFQNPDHQLVEATVAEELHAAADPALAAEDRAALVDDLLRRFRLEAHRNRHPRSLSGGEKRRLATGTALLSGHRIICFDEPTYGQDAETAAELLAELERLREEGVTVVLVAHDLQLVVEHADALAVLDAGRLLDAGPVREVFARGCLDKAGLRLPPLAEAAVGLPAASGMRSLLRLADLDRIEAPRHGSPAVAAG